MGTKRKAESGGESGQLETTEKPQAKKSRALGIRTPKKSLVHDTEKGGYGASLIEKPRKRNKGKVKAEGPHEQVAIKTGKEEKAENGATEVDDAPKNARFIVFVGNLPYTATKAKLEEHFAAVKPTSVRLLDHKTDKTKTRGIAFVEFDHYGRMETCLQRYHHSDFNDGVSPARRINVELT